MTKKRPLFRLVLGVLGLSLAAFLSAFIYVQVRDQGSGALSVLLSNLVLKVIAIYLLSFLCLLVVRYLVLMLYSFFEHYERIHGAFRNQHAEPTVADDSVLPLLSLIHI